MFDPGRMLRPGRPSRRRERGEWVARRRDSGGDTRVESIVPGHGRNDGQWQVILTFTMDASGGRVLGVCRLDASGGSDAGVSCASTWRPWREPQDEYEEEEDEEEGEGERDTTGRRGRVLGMAGM